MATMLVQEQKLLAGSKGPEIGRAHFFGHRRRIHAFQSWSRDEGHGPAWPSRRLCHGEAWPMWSSVWARMPEAQPESQRR
jgi:hypothetical protein